jgi:cytochrome c peroxidase
VVARSLIVAFVVMLAGCAADRLVSASTAVAPGAAIKAADVGVDPALVPKVALGFRLWFEPRLSGNGKMSCATCHSHLSGFSNGEATAEGIRGQRGSRNVPTIYAASASETQFWDGRAESLEAQALGPITNPIEMDANMDDVVARLQAMPYYAGKFKAIYGTGVTPAGMAEAIAAFERALEVGPSAYERFWAGETTALTAQQKRGMAIFNSPRGRCVASHGTADLTDRAFHNIGVGYGPEGQPPKDLGRGGITQRDEDTGAFKTPTLRNVAKTAPYMHDGSLATLKDVVAFYNRGGSPNAHQDPRIRPLDLDEADQAALVAFLEALSGPDNLKALAKLPGIKNAKEAPLALPADLLR